MSSPLHDRRGQHGSQDDATVGGPESSSLSITVIVQNRLTIDSEAVTGSQLKEAAGVPADFALYRRVRGGNELVPDDTQIELRNGDHFFARPQQRDA
jgi:hypothetical protein